MERRLHEQGQRLGVAWAIIYLWSLAWGRLSQHKRTQNHVRVNLEEEQVTHKVPGDLPLLQDPTLILPILSHTLVL